MKVVCTHETYKGHRIPMYEWRNKQLNELGIC